MDLSELPQEQRDFIYTKTQEEQSKDVELFTCIPHNVHVGYENLTSDEVLRKLLPEEIREIPSSFEQVGHIAHLNLRDEVLPYKSLIGQVIIDVCFYSVLTNVEKSISENGCEQTA
jgi:tRNA (guanine37-N1)-methyltransferase